MTQSVTTVPRILIVDDDPALLQALPETLRLRMPGLLVDTADSARAALARIAATDYDAIVSDVKMPDMDGLALLAEIRVLCPTTPTLLITGHGEHDLALQALRGGAYDFIQKPLDRDYFVASLDRAIQMRQLSRQAEGKRMAEAALAASEGRMRTIVNAAHEAFIAIDADGVITDWNHQAEVTLGWSRDEALGKPLAETIIPPQYRDAHKRGLQRFLATGEGPVLNKRIEITALHRDGHELPVELTITPIRWGDKYLFGAFLRDITERQQAEEERDRFFTLTLDLLYIAGFDGYFKRLNPAWERTLGFTTAELLAEPYMNFVHPDDREATAAESKKIDTGAEVISFENRYRCKDGSYRLLLWTAKPFVGRQLIYAAARDITERKRWEQEREELVKQLRKSQEELMSKVDDLERFHDIAVGRELKMLELEKEVLRLKQ